MRGSPSVAAREAAAAADARLLGEAAALEAVRVWHATRPRRQPAPRAWLASQPKLEARAWVFTPMAPGSWREGATR